MWELGLLQYSSIMNINRDPMFLLSLLLFFSISSTSNAKIIPRFLSKSNLPSTDSLSVALKQNNPKYSYETKYFTQNLDHFNFNPQSYQNFSKGDIEWFAKNTGFMFEVAPKFKALLVFIEHRYYGKSIPFCGDKEVASSNTSTLGYLTSTQALADYATLIIDLKKNLTAEDSPVVVIGGSYGGMLAAWFRLKYPHVAIGALASSAPILNFENITSPYSFSNIISQDFKSESANCYEVIKGSWKQIQNKAGQPGGLEELRKSFKICKNYINANALEGWLQTAFVYTSMTDYPTPSNFLAPLPAYPIKQMCKAIDEGRERNDTFAGLYGAANIYYNYSGSATCFNLSDKSDPHGLAGWTWQACTEMVMPTDGNNEHSIFPPSKWNVMDRFTFCKALFDVQPRPNWISTEYGGHDIKRVLKRFGSNMIFFNGLRDPWSGGGVLKNISESIIALVAEHGAHHVDLRFSTKDDPKWLTEIRRKEIEIIQLWLHQYYNDLHL
ncbi:hypothetical protein Sjap_001082 [Stephania japonica]|uniref:Lysosomal Pro-X carboxypeptidase n=1 Tax=Stephania japonica TaxID=461633 RepID=A0AAP0KLK6_9MAGN